MDRVLGFQLYTNNSQAIAQPSTYHLTETAISALWVKPCWNLEIKEF